MARLRDLLFTPSVQAAQARMGSRAAYGRTPPATGPEPLGPDESAFLAERDSFYMATVGEGGWPYVQHRGGPKGFVRVLDPGTIGFADFRGNRQYISVGHLAHDDRVALIFVDYPRQARLKILAHASIVTQADAPDLLARLAPERYDAKIERGIVLRVEGFDWNCAQHITPRFSEDELRGALAPLRRRLEALEAENRRLKGDAAVRS